MFKRKTTFFVFCCSFLVTVMVAQQIKTVCYGATKTYSVDLDDGSVGTMGSSYDWTILEPNSAIITGNGKNRVSVNWGKTTPGNYTIQVIETNESCMSSTSIVSVAIRSNPKVVAEGASVCEGFLGQLTSSASPISSSFQFNWKCPEGALNPGNVAFFETTVPGDYVVTVMDNFGCVSDPAVATLIVNKRPNIAIVAEGETKFCEGGSVLLSAPAGLEGYIWSKDGISIDSAFDRQYNADSTGGYTVTAVDANGCVNTTEYPFFIEVNPLPNFNITVSGPTELCEGETVALSVNSGENDYSYKWLKNGLEMINQKESVFVASVSSSYSVIIQDSNSCEVMSDGIAVIVRPNPDATITNNMPSSTFCEGSQVVLSVPLVPGYSYQWSASGGQIFGATNATYVANESSDYSVRVIDTNFDSFCTSISSLPIKLVKKVLPVVSEIVED